MTKVKKSIERAAQVWCTEKTKHKEMDVELAEEFANILDEYIDALIWCSGSADFGPGGQAEKGFNKICRPLISEENQ